MHLYEVQYLRKPVLYIVMGISLVCNILILYLGDAPLWLSLVTLGIILTATLFTLLVRFSTIANSRVEATIKANMTVAMAKYGEEIPIKMHYMGTINLKQIVRKACHNLAVLFRIPECGYLREGHYADLVLVDPNKAWTMHKNNVLAKCGWSRFEGTTFTSRVTHTFVNGHLAYANGQFDESRLGERLRFKG